MNIRTLTLLFFTTLTIHGVSQENKKEYNFTVTKNNEATSVKNQGRTGTCWSFSTTSFVESELIRLGLGKLDLSEMFVVRNIYIDKAKNYVYRQGKANFSEGSLAHDVINAINKHGLMPQSAYTGNAKDGEYNHSEMVRVLKGVLDNLLESKELNENWLDIFIKVMDTYLGTPNSTFVVNGKKHSPLSYRASLKFPVLDYISLTSFEMEYYNQPVILNIPDNFSNGSFYNIKLETLFQTCTTALKNGYTLTWDADVSEKGFSQKNGMAILPKENSTLEGDDAFKYIVPEMEVTPEIRQQQFNIMKTTDDHLMHITGLVEDADGNTYFITKNSWGERGKLEGYLYVSEAYFKMKTIAVTIHKDALDKDLKKKLRL